MNSELQQRLREHLEHLARRGEIISYRQLAILAEVPAPKVIRRLAQALEDIIREDYAAGIKTSVAGLVVSQTSSAMPRAGFFMLLRELGFYNGPDEGPVAQGFYADYLQEVFEAFSEVD